MQPTRSTTTTARSRASPRDPRKPTGQWNRRPRRDRRALEHGHYPKRRSEAGVKITIDHSASPPATT